MKLKADVSWQSQGACLPHPPHWWFPPRGPYSKDIDKAKVICQRCPVRIDCLTYALQEGIRYGIWGGKSEKERRKIRKAMGYTSQTNFIIRDIRRSG